MSPDLLAVPPLVQTTRGALPQGSTPSGRHTRLAAPAAAAAATAAARVARGCDPRGVELLLLDYHGRELLLVVLLLRRQLPLDGLDEGGATLL